MAAHARTSNLQATDTWLHQHTQNVRELPIEHLQVLGLLLLLLLLLVAACAHLTAPQWQPP
jgi:hypothetical protein